MLSTLFLFISVIALTFSPKQYETQFIKIEFSSKGCFGKCPVWKMTIENDNEAYLFAEKYNKVNGNFKAIIGKNEIVELESILSILQKINVKEYYNDGPTCGNINDLKIYLKDKIITTRSMRISGPREVQDLLIAINDINEKTSWQAADLQ